MCLLDLNVSWTDIAQAISAILVAAITVPATVISLYKLLKRDKDRETEIISLSTIAQELQKMQAETELRYRKSKIPVFNIEMERIENGDNYEITLKFTNVNRGVEILDYISSSKFVDDSEIKVVKSIINNNNGVQSFKITICINRTSSSEIEINNEYISNDRSEYSQLIILQSKYGIHSFNPYLVKEKTFKNL